MARVFKRTSQEGFVMIAINPVTKDRLTTGHVSDKYRDNCDAIFGDSKKLSENKNLISKTEKSMKNGNKTENWRQS